MIEYCDIYGYLPIFGYGFDGVAQRPRIRSSVLIDEYFRSHSLKISGKDPMCKRMSGNVYHDFFDVCMNFRKRADFFTTMDSARP